MTRRGRSGQILAVSALVIALIMISTAAYIYDLSGNIGDSEAYLLNDYVQSIKLGSEHALISALANITNGGRNETLAANLDAWSTLAGRQYTFGTLALNYTLRTISPYASGLYLNWGTNGNGVSEACSDFILNASGRDLKMQYPFYINVSTRLQVEGYLTQISPLTEQVTIVWRLFNKGQPALAQNFTVFYKDSGVWLVPNVANSYPLLDYGNGTYRATFTLTTLVTSLDVSAQVFDSRDIFVRANATLAQQ
jgi:hypothetical protein